ncbi:PilW family protein [Methylobacter sp. S3L5C]|uniref:PilW family protein n=1 Tax=Methylobacter sp. S3L5C TaxID=2839024 RepID=UPI001FAB89A2|nr:PilW family protein [Methylobacter sp. S3L5C]UOA07566.1 PilW family protein [Methylobacter sp. S3L5C]
MKTKPYQSGLSLIEIMIALLIGAFLIGGVLQIFISSKQTYRMQQNLSRLQENGRFSLDFLAKDIRMAGYWGCLSPNSPNTDIAGTDNNAVSGDSIDNGTDTITLKGAFVLTPTGTCGTPVNTSAAYYTGNSSVITYKINTGVLQQNTNGQNNDLIEGIENMQFLYGVDTDSDGTTGYGTPNYYVPASSVTNMNQVVSIRISLLATTLDDNLTTQPQPYTYNGTTTTPTNRKIRRVFTSTIALRNRLR